MKVFIDAQLPELLKEVLNSLGLDSMHVLELPKGDETTDLEIRKFVDEKDFMLMTKDSDFYHSHISLQQPNKLFLITTGNIKNRELFDLFRNNSMLIKQAISRSNFIELNNEGIFERD